MTTKLQRKNMMDYLIDKLEGSEEIVQPISKNMNGIETNYILFGPSRDKIDGISVLVDKKFTKRRFDRLNSLINYAKDGSGETKFHRKNYIFLKDESTFFRSAAEDIRYKSTKNLSLKYYDEGKIDNAKLLTPEEIFSKDQNLGYVQYCQPESSREEFGILTYLYGFFEFNYDHIDNSFAKEGESKRWFIANKRRLDQGDLKLHNNGYILDRSFTN